MASDPYAPYLLHGTLPLVADPGSPAGIRFARPWRDAPGDCVTDPSQLPDGEATLRAFGSAQAREGYVEAVADLGDNAVSCVGSPEGHGLPPLLLVVRHDRPRREGATLDGCVRLASPFPDLAARYARHLASEGEAAARTRAHGDFERRWGPELAAVRAARAMLVGTDPARDTFSMIPTGAPEPVTVARGPDGVRMSWRPVRTRLPDDLRGELRAGLDALGVEERPDGSLSLAARVLDADAVARAGRAMAEASALERRLGRISGNRESMERLLRDDGQVRVLRRMAAGCPVLSPGEGLPSGQLSPRAGRSVTIAGSRLRDLVGLGVAGLAWQDADGGLPEGKFPCPAVYGLTGTGRALLAGDVDAAAAGVPHHWREAGRALPPMPFRDAMAALRAGLADADAESLAAAATVEDGTGLATALRGRPTLDAWAGIVAGMVSGALDMEPDGTLRTVQTERPAP